MAHCLACKCGDGCLAGPGDRWHQSAHQWGVFHHDYPGLCPDALLSSSELEDLWWRRWRAYRAQHLCWVLDLRQPTTLYYVAWLGLCLVLWLGRRLVHSRFGVVLRGIKENERRMQALGYATFAYKLVGFVIAGRRRRARWSPARESNSVRQPGAAALDALRRNHGHGASGGMGSGFGPVLGAITLLLAEEILSSYTEHWMLFLGPMLLVVVLRARRGLYGLVPAEDVQP